MHEVWDRHALMAAHALERVFGRALRYARTSSDPAAPWTDAEGVFTAGAVAVGGDRGFGAVAPTVGVEPILDIRRDGLGFVPARGDRVEIDGTAYTVVDLEDETLGPVFRLRLHRGIASRL